MTKSEHILSLYDGKRSALEIARIVGCRDSYVRVVARQRKGKLSEVDKRYRETEAGIRSSRRKAPKMRAYAAAWYAEFKASNNRERARAAGRAAYQKARSDS